MTSSAVQQIVKLGFPWQTRDPFLFCVHHLDHFPAGNEVMGPDPSLLKGRRIGMDFEIKDGWRMYHGDTVPGFPAHPHRGFETVTVARQGFIDHSDSLGAAARFGRGDTQWMTAGKGVVHSEMFPLLKRDEGNTGELFQIWLNLPRSKKMAPPHFAMLWHEDIPKVEPSEGAEVTVIAGSWGEAKAPAPPPDSWASDPEHDVAIMTFSLQPGASLRVPATSSETGRTLYFYAGTTLEIDGVEVHPDHGVVVDPSADLTLKNTGEELAEVLMLQGRPIGEPVAQHGPFVMNSEGEIRQAMLDYQQTRFGGWPWPSPAPVHERDAGRFALHADGTREERS